MSKQDLPPEVIPPNSDTPAPDDWVAKTQPSSAEDIPTIKVPTDATPPHHWDEASEERTAEHRA